MRLLPPIQTRLVGLRPPKSCLVSLYSDVLVYATQHCFVTGFAETEGLQSHSPQSTMLSCATFSNPPVFRSQVKWIRDESMTGDCMEKTSLMCLFFFFFVQAVRCAYLRLIKILKCFCCPHQRMPFGSPRPRFLLSLKRQGLASEGKG